MGLGLVTTRLMSDYLSVRDYGTYSQILLIISTVTSLTILGMIDGVNFFYCEQTEQEKKDAYNATFFSLQIAVGSIAGVVVLLSGAWICTYFENYDLKGLLVFAAVFPLLHNLIGMLQVLLVSIGKARMLAIRNFVISSLRLLAIALLLSIIRNAVVILAANFVLDLMQILFFIFMLRKNGCRIRLRKTDVHLLKRIFQYCLPMAVFIAVNSLNRDIDKYLISMMTDTETLAIYANASKQLPLDIIMASFCTVLIPYVTRFIANKESEKAFALYKQFLEIAYITTGILCCAAITVAPQLMNLLYTGKYESGLHIFVVYILVDLLRFTNITLVLTAAGKTKLLMITGIVSLGFNALLNVVMYNLCGTIGPALATLITTLLLGIFMLWENAKTLCTSFIKIFDWKVLLPFAVGSTVLTLILYWLQTLLHEQGIHFFVILFVVCSIYCGTMLMFTIKRLMTNFRTVNDITKRTSA